MSRAALVCIIAGSLCVLAGCRREPLPEAESPAAQIYVQDCGTNCHIPYNPHSMTAAMWELEVIRMQEKMRTAGHPMTPDDERAILEYLLRNAGQN